MIFQIDTTMIERSSTLEPRDIGTWCFLVDGTYQGFYRSRREAERAYGHVVKPRNG